MSINLNKHFRVAAQSFHMQLVQIAEYKTNFLFDVLARVVGFIIFWFMWEAILGNASIPGWDLKGLLILAGIQNICVSLTLIFMYGAGSIRRAVVKGDLDNYLSRPTIPWIPIIAQHGYFAIAGILMGFALLGAAWFGFGFHADLLIFLLIGAFILVGMCIAFCFGLTIASLTFWLGKNDLFEHLYWGAFEFESYPANIFPGGIQLILAFTVPFMLLHTIPALLLLDRMPVGVALQWLGAGLLVLLANASIARFIWNRGLKRYEAFG